MVIIADRSPVWTATIAAEEHRNALTRQMVADLIDAVSRFTTDGDARVLVICGSGRAAFCAGADLKEMAADAVTQEFVPVMPRLYEQILSCPKPVIAMLNGDAVGGGLEMALCCDIVVARIGARIGLPETRLGTVPRYGAALLARQAGAQAALAIALLGDLRRIEDTTATAALVVPSEQLEKTTYGIADQLANRSGAALAAVKLVVRSANEYNLAELAALPSVAAAIQSDDRRRGVSEFAKKGPSPSDD
jgi:enoyl-CoA hydratase/carnithine racemase